jgi:hypothetical protein
MFKATSDFVPEMSKDIETGPKQLLVTNSLMNSDATTSDVTEVEILEKTKQLTVALQEETNAKNNLQRLLEEKCHFKSEEYTFWELYTTARIAAGKAKHSLEETINRFTLKFRNKTDHPIAALL